MVSWLGLVVSMVWFGCASEPVVAPPTASEPSVVTVSYPVQWLVEQLVPEGAVVRHLAGECDDPVRCSPRGEVVASLASASLVIANGHGYEAWLKTASVPTDALVYTGAKVEAFEVEGHTHSHGKGGHHSHVEKDPRIWMDPNHYRLQARAVADSLAALYPSQSSQINANYEVLNQQLTALDNEYVEVFAQLSDSQFASDKRSFNYLFKRYGQGITTVDARSHQHFNADRVRGWAGKSAAPVFVWSTSPTNEEQQAIGAIPNIALNPLEKPDELGYDYIRMARGNLAALRSLTPQN